QEYGSELATERVEERLTPIMNEENITNVNTSEPKKSFTKKHQASTLLGLKSSQTITSDNMNEEYVKKVKSNNQQVKKIKASQNK
ncbi:14478_t:CDS:2, partial [Racocetra persica]